MSDLRNLNQHIFSAPSESSSFSSFPARSGAPAVRGLADMDGTLSQDEIINSIFDIAGRIFGAHELALYAVEWDFSTLHLIGSRGIGPQVLINMRKGRIGETAFSGKEYIAEKPVSPHGEAGEGRLAICVPFLLNGTSAFVLAIYGSVSFDHLTSDDPETIEFLRTHAATVLSRRMA